MFTAVANLKTIGIQPPTPTIPKPSAAGKSHAIKAVDYRPLAKVRLIDGDDTLYGVYWSGVGKEGTKNQGWHVGLLKLTKQSDFTRMAKITKWNRMKFFHISEVEVVS